jgi:hypothetical protein
MRGAGLPFTASQPRAKAGIVLFAFGLLLETFAPAFGEESPPPDGSADQAAPFVRIRVEEFYGVNDDDDNSNGIYDSDPSEAPFLDSHGNLVLDDNLNPARLYLINPGGVSMEGDEVFLHVDDGQRLWNSPRKEYDLTHAVFTIDAANVPRWQAPDGVELVFPCHIFIEGIVPGTGMVSIILRDHDNPGNGGPVR